MRLVLELDGREHEVFLQREADVVKIQVDGQPFEAKLGEEGLVVLGEHKFHVKVGERSVTVGDQEIPFRIQDFQPAASAGGKGGARGARVKPPMPGKIVSLQVEEGQEVQAGAVLLILEAMKMQNEITSPASGVIKKVHVKPGQNVEGKDVLVELE